MYKVGDEVLIKGEVVEVAKDVTYPIGVRLRCATVPMLFTEEELELSAKTYEMGLSDAWELAKKIVMGVTDGGFESRKVIDVFGKTAYYTLKELTYEEALAKIEAYEKEKSVCVGDVVKNVHNGAEYIVLDTKDGRSINTSFTAFSKLNICGFENDVWKKTGKHIDIENLLKQIGE